jgi:hypothetical protein
VVGEQMVAGNKRRGVNLMRSNSRAGIAKLTESPPAVDARASIARDPYTHMQRTIIVPHNSDGIVAMIEVLSRGN